MSKHFGRFFQYLYVVGGGLCGLMWLSPAFADSCDTIDSNKQWGVTFEKLNEAYKDKDWNKALEYSRTLESICEQSPILNYTIANIHKNKGDREKYLFYLQKATQNTEHFSVEKNLLDRIWSEKYEATHPEATQASIDNYKNRIASLEADLEALERSREELSKSTISKDQVLQNKIDDYKTPMWAGAGIGIGGLVMAGVGAALVAKSEPANFNDKTGSSYNENVAHASGWVLLGVGSGLAITGAVFAGIFGYKYRHSKDSQTLTFNVTPGYATIQFEF